MKNGDFTVSCFFPLGKTLNSHGIKMVYFHGSKVEVKQNRVHMFYFHGSPGFMLASMDFFHGSNQYFQWSAWDFTI